MKLTSLTFTTIVALSACVGPEGNNRTSQVDQIFEKWSTPNSPGCAVGIMEAGQIVLEKAYGMADLQHGIENTAETIFENGSVSKQFTSAAIILLAIEGKLALNDDVREYVPEVPDYGNKISLHHLMTHTSGLRDWGSVASISGWPRHERSHNHSDVLDIISQQTALNFHPGSEYSYSNTGYNLLAMVVERVSGIPFAQFSANHIFNPLGMNHTQWRDDHRRIVPGRSTAYRALGDSEFEILQPIEHVHGNGGLLTTVNDLLIWNQALEDGRIGGKRFLGMMHEQGRLTDNSLITYAGGLQIDSYKGIKRISHTGSTAGYRAFVARYPEHNLSIALLCNTSDANPGSIRDQIADIFIGEFVKNPEPPQALSLAPEIVASYAGLYYEPVTGQTKKLEMTNGQLYDDGSKLVPTSSSIFVNPANTTHYIFEIQEDSVKAFSLDSWQYTNKRYERTNSWDPGTVELENLAGTYSSNDSRTTYTVKVMNDRLVLEQNPGRIQVLTPIYEDAFVGNFGVPGFDKSWDSERFSSNGIFRFWRNSRGVATELSGSWGRVFDMRFQRQDS